MPAPLLRMGDGVRLVEVNGHRLLVDVVRLQRLTVDAELLPMCEKALTGPHEPDELAATLPGGRRPAALAFLAYLVDKGFLSAEPTSPSTMDDVLVPPGPAGTSATYWQPDPVRLDDFTASPAGLRPVKALLLGGCVVQFAVDALTRAGLRRGLDVTAVHAWPTVRGRLRDLIDRHQPDLAVLQPTVQPFLTGLWDDGVYATPAERRRRLAICKRALTAAITEFAEALGDRLGLVHNVAGLAVSPHGRYDFRHEANHREIVADLNRHVDEQVRRHPQLLVVDEERLAVRHGAERLFDDLVFPFGHHGGRPDPEIDTPNQLSDLSDALAAEYVAGYLAHHRIGQIKCVVVDLDGTLWPGIAADDGFGWVHGDDTGRWVHFGLHQALRLLRARGVLLATCSKGTEEATLAAWREAPDGGLLTPGDFVLHQINWRAKSANLAELCDRLGVAPEAVLFLDDNPVERAEVRRHLPGVRVADVPVHRFRELLLTEPGLESPADTAEARTRTETTRAMLRRTELAATADGDDFLRELEIAVSVWPARETDLDRAAELFNRTNQFTTTAWRTTPAELAGLVAGGAQLRLMSVRDRFADYGIVGACLVRDAAVEALAVSCRVIGLDVGPGFLAVCAATATRSGTGGTEAGTVTGRVTETGRNTAALDVFTRAGFSPAGEGRFRLDRPTDLIDIGTLPQTFEQAVDSGLPQTFEQATEESR